MYCGAFPSRTPISIACQTYGMNPDDGVRLLSSGKKTFLIGNILAELADWRKKVSFSVARKGPG